MSFWGRRLHPPRPNLPELAAKRSAAVRSELRGRDGVEPDDETVPAPNKPKHATVAPPPPLPTDCRPFVRWWSRQRTFGQLRGSAGCFMATLPGARLPTATASPRTAAPSTALHDNMRAAWPFVTRSERWELAVALRKLGVVLAVVLLEPAGPIVQVVPHHTDPQLLPAAS